MINYLVIYYSKEKTENLSSKIFSLFYKQKYNNENTLPLGYYCYFYEEKAFYSHI